MFEYFRQARVGQRCIALTALLVTLCIGRAARADHQTPRVYIDHLVQLAHDKQLARDEEWIRLIT